MGFVQRPKSVQIFVVRTKLHEPFVNCELWIVNWQLSMADGYLESHYAEYEKKKAEWLKKKKKWSYKKPTNDSPCMD